MLIKRTGIWALLVILSLVLVIDRERAMSQESLPAYLSDRGEGVTTSLFGTYVKKGDLLIYPFYEYEKKSKDEYHGSEVVRGSTDTKDYLGESELHEALLFFAYGVTDDVAVEFESALYETATLTKAKDDTTSGMPPQIEESGFSSTQAEVRWRVQRETETQPEIFTALEIEFPLQKNRVLIGAGDWEVVVALGWVKGLSWGTLTPRLSVEYDGGDKEVEFGEYALEYLKRLSDQWRVVATLEGHADEISLIGELQYFINSGTYLKLNSGFGLTGHTPELAPEVGVMFTF
jgi:hypothetical protein